MLFFFRAPATIVEKFPYYDTCPESNDHREEWVVGYSGPHLGYRGSPRFLILL